MRTLLRFAGLVMVLAMAAPAVSAGKIKLKDGAEIDGMLLDRDGERVVIGLRRADVVSIDGKALPPPVTSGTPAPNFKAVDLDGNTHVMSDNQGRATLLKFWATWCPHCRSDVGLMKSLSEQYGDQLRILTVSLDQKPDALAQFLKEQEVHYPVIAAHGANIPVEQAQIPALYEAGGIPSYFLVDSKGIIAKTFAGSLSESNTDMDTFLKDALPPKSRKSASSR